MENRKLANETVMSSIMLLVLWIWSAITNHYWIAWLSLVLVIIIWIVVLFIMRFIWIALILLVITLIFIILPNYTAILELFKSFINLAPHIFCQKC